jgi:hypothetical protein
MASIESLIVGSEKLTKIFGYWPSFHDAEVLELHFVRGSVQPEKGVYDFPVLTLKVHVWQLTKSVDPEGYLILEHHTLATLQFRDISDFQMQGFNHQNAMMELVLAIKERTEGPSPYFAVEVIPACGMGASFTCLKMQVVDAVEGGPDIVSQSRWTTISNKVENCRHHESAKRRIEPIELGEGCIAKQQHEAECKQEPGVKEKYAVTHREVTVQRAKENEARVKANPTPPHGGF